MTLSRWRRVATGIAAGVIVLCAAVLGASFRTDSESVSVASDTRVATSVPTTEDPAQAADSTDAVRVIDEEDLPDESATEAAADTDDPPAPTAATEEPDPDADTTEADTTEADTETDAGSTATDEAAAAAPDDDVSAEEAPSPAPLTADDGALGTGGGIDGAECGLDRLVVYGGARVGGVGRLLRDAIIGSGFGAECDDPVAVLASNCPLQFSGVLGADSGYDPQQSFVASSANIDRETLGAVLGEVGYSGAEIDILPFSFSNAESPDETWIAIFVPPSFSGWQALADRAGTPATSQSLCAPSGQLAG